MREYTAGRAGAAHANSSIASVAVQSRFDQPRERNGGSAAMSRWAAHDGPDKAVIRPKNQGNP